MASTIDRHDFELSNGILTCWILELVDGSVWFRGNDIAAFLGYSRPRDAVLKNVNPHYRKTWGELKKLLPNTKSPSNWQPTVWMISIEGVRCLLEKTKLPVPKQTIEEMARVFDVDLSLPQEPEELNYISPKPEELNYISAIREAFYFYKSTPQFHIGEYTIELYFPDHKIAIEHDEFNHDPSYRYEREKFIKEQLNCQFLRFNPDIKMFSIFKFIGDLSRVFFLDSPPNNSSSDLETYSTPSSSSLEWDTCSCSCESDDSSSDMITCSCSSDSGIEY